MKKALVATMLFLVGCATTPPEGPTEEPAEPKPFVLGEEGETVRPVSPDDMNAATLGTLLHDIADGIEGEAPVWEFEFRGVKMALLTDQGNDRMRIIAPILPVEEIDADVLAILLEANFHTALDARYATSDGVIYSTFIHPLSSLTPEDFHSALKQVSSLVITFGTTFSSGSFGFTR